MWAKAKCDIKIRLYNSLSLRITKGTVCQVIRIELYRRLGFRYILMYKGVKFTATEGYCLRNFEIFDDSLFILCWNRLTKAFLY